MFAGGPHVDWFMEKMYNVTDVFDVLAYGEGEETITLLADYVEGNKKLEDIPNIIYKKNGEVIKTRLKRVENLNLIPYPVYDNEIYPAMKDNQKLKMITIDESRGCPNSCNFCIHPQKSGKKWRITDTVRLVDIMERIKTDTGIKIFRFAGSNTPTLLRKSIAQEIITRDLKFKYIALAHLRNVKPDDMKILKQSGCYVLAFGLESGSQKILDEIINKKITVNQIIAGIQNCKESGIITIVSIIIPAPNETEQTKNETFRLLLQTRPDAISLFPPALVMNTEWDMNRKKFGFEISNETFFEKEMFYDENIFLPLALWDTFPEYHVNNKNIVQLLEECNGFSSILEKEGVNTHLFAEHYLFSNYTKLTPKEFNKITDLYLFTGDHKNLYNLIVETNKNIIRD
jgi:radical SAM superfamily enzyme YgiQ (UPF0313 family)